MSDNVIHLAFRNPRLVDDTMAMLSCVGCKNKTFTFTQMVVGDFPVMRCAACGDHLGKMGWVHDEDD